MSALRIFLPVVLGVVAAVLNFMVLRGSTAKLELTVLNADLEKADAEITPDMLGSLEVRADKEVFKSVVPYADRGLLLHRRVKRRISKGEVLLYADVQDRDEEDISLYLDPGETTLTIPVKSSRVAPGLRRGHPVGVVVSLRPAMDPTKTTMRTPAAVEKRVLGPFRLLSLGTPSEPYAGSGIADSRLVLVATKPGPNGKLDSMAASLQEAIAPAASLSNNNNDIGVLEVVHYKVAK